ncbi:MAG: FeoA family protein [Gemmatimonadota bacterium]
MSAEYLTCPMCGYEFEPADTLCAHGCPLGSLCRLSRCPNCEYEFPETPRAVSWLRRFLSRGRAAPEALPEGVRTAEELRSGEKATVLCCGASRSSRSDTLTVFGLVPGAEITLIQRRPACVLRVGETELALDPAIAREILVQPARADAQERRPAS